MDIKRNRFQGLINIIHFNWHFYLIAIFFLFLFIFFKANLSDQVQFYIGWITGPFLFMILFSILISFYIYDLSSLYRLYFLPNTNNKSILNIHAGFDETSQIILLKYPLSNLTICDFYNSDTHTEISIKRARLAYTPIKGTIQVSTNKLPFIDNSFDYIIIFLSAHEIRNEIERVKFFDEIKRVSKPTAKIYVIEHLRDFNNFIAYSIGFFHFLSNKTWLRTFNKAKLYVKNVSKITPFITTYTLNKNGSTS